MNNQQVYGSLFLILMTFGGLWLLRFPLYPIRALGIAPLYLSTIFYTKVMLGEKVSSKYTEKRSTE